MKILFALLALVGAGLGSSLGPAQARDFGYEKFADAVQAVYGDGYGAITPFDDITSPADDPSRRGEGYPGQVWNFVSVPGRNHGLIYQHNDVYCPVPGGGPAPQ